MARVPKTLLPKYFYDERGSELFDEITRLPEYYPTRAERALLEHESAAIVRQAAPRTLVELGAGSSDKTRALLDAMRDPMGHEPFSDNSGPTAALAYVPVDVSADFLERSAERLREAYPDLAITPIAADFSAPFEIPSHPVPALHAFLGSTIGNFTPPDAVTFLRTVRRRMDRNDHFLLGVDLRKDVAVLERAYNDSQGVTAEFNRNILRVLNSALGANFNPERFEHRAIFNTREHRIEMHLVSVGTQAVSIPGVGEVRFEDGEYILTEVSHKYDRETVVGLLRDGGMGLLRWITDDSGLFALALARVSV